MLRDKLRRPPRQSTSPVIEMRARARAPGAQSSGVVGRFDSASNRKMARFHRAAISFPPCRPIARYKCRNAPPGTARCLKFRFSDPAFGEVVPSPSRDAFVPRNINATRLPRALAFLFPSLTLQHAREFAWIVAFSYRAFLRERRSRRFFLLPWHCPDNASFDHDDFATTDENQRWHDKAGSWKRARGRGRESCIAKKSLSPSARARSFLRALGPFRPVSSWWVAPCNFNRP
jgi:hypothetical protein